MRFFSLILCIGFFAIAVFFYVKAWRAIIELVSQARLAKPSRKFYRFWWTPAWRVHKRAYPTSKIRRQIVLNFALTFGCMLIAMVCLAYTELHGFF